MKENWKAVLGYSGYYEVSDLGRVRSLDREIWHPSKNCYRTYPGRILKPTKSGPEGNQYFSVGLSKNGLQKKSKVHILVLEAFVGPRPEGLVACHGDKGSLDNSLSNLEWGTYEVNNGKHKIRDNTLVYGENHVNAKLSNDEVLEIYEMAWSGKYLLRAIAEMYNVDLSNVSSIKHGRRQSRITGHENTRKKYKKFAR